ncbi:hypothetical protein FOA52_007577 [Chlamydomonas sp. UWO 241]|nr:hypothetical protein FOA52_007577 [Chlamydomonas sp. UWO 241]
MQTETLDAILIVLTTVWIEGEKLSESSASDVRTLCSTLLNAYLIQLLETGFLHADPHPGNLIRTTDGRICILDMGLMTEVSEAQRLALLDYIAHLCTEDWYPLAVDLQVMGFIPPDVDVTEGGLVEPLGKIMKQLVGGGGAAKVNIDKVTYNLTELGKTYPFRIPPFFALILRAFSVIEGIALGVDPDYAIVGECFPYLSRRLLSDDSPTTRKLVRDVLYGGKARLDVERLTRLASGFAAFSTDGIAPPAGAAGAAPAARPAVAAAAYTTALATAAAAGPSGRSSGSALLPAITASAGVGTGSAAPLDPVLRDALIATLGRRGTYIQELLVEEAATAIDALSAGTVDAVVRALLQSAPAAFFSQATTAMGPLRPLLLPLPTLYETLSALAPSLAVTPEDEEALAVVRALAALAQKLSPPADAQGGVGAAWATTTTAGGAGGNGSQAEAVRAAARTAAAQFGPLLPQLAPGLTYMGEGLTRALLARATARTRARFPVPAGFESPVAALGFFSGQMMQAQLNFLAAAQRK